MDKAHLVGIHKAGIAHHVAAIGQIDRQYRTPSMLNSTGAMIVEILIIMSPNIATGEVGLNPAQEFGIDGHEVLELSVLRTLFDHPDLSIAVHNLSLDFTDLLIDENPIIFLTAENFFPCFNHTFRAQRIGLTRPPQNGLGFLPGFQKRFIRPFRGKGGPGSILVEKLNGIESNSSPKTEGGIQRFQSA
jgi:hypothetical protein